MKKRNIQYNDINGEHHSGLDKEGKNNTKFFLIHWSLSCRPES